MLNFYICLPWQRKESQDMSKCNFPLVIIWITMFISHSHHTRLHLTVIVSVFTANNLSHWISKWIISSKFFINFFFQYNFFYYSKVSVRFMFFCLPMEDWLNDITNLIAYDRLLTRLDYVLHSIRN